MKNTLKHKKFLIPFFIFSLLSCSQQNLSTQDSAEKIKLSENVSTAKVSSKIEPKITAGQTFLNFKNGDSNLILNVRLSQKDGKNFTGDGAPAFFTKAAESGTTVSTISKVETKLSINGEEYKFDIPSDKLEANQHKINLTGLEKGDVVSLDGKVIDDKGAVVGSESIKDKKINKDIDTADLNISVNINISVTTTQSVVVNQTQTGPTINITIPTAAPSNSSANACITPAPDHTVTLSDGTKIQMCPPPDVSDAKDAKYEGCLRPNTKFQVGLKDGRVIQICEPPKEQKQDAKPMEAK